MLFNKMRSAITPRLMEQIHQHPFNMSLCKGTLPRAIFQEFLDQDQLYLMDMSCALKKVASRCAHPPHQQLFLQLSSYVLNETSFVQRSTIPRFFQTTRPVKNKAIVDYTNFLLDTSNNAAIGTAIASLLPCFYIYSELGARMQPMVKANNPYKLWIASYSSEKFLAYTQQIIRVTRELESDLTTDEENHMIDAFIKSTKFELAFWDSLSPISQEATNSNFVNVP